MKAALNETRMSWVFEADGATVGAGEKNPMEYTYEKLPISTGVGTRKLNDIDSPKEKWSVATGVGKSVGIGSLYDAEKSNEKELSRLPLGVGAGTMDKTE